MDTGSKSRPSGDTKRATVFTSPTRIKNVNCRPDRGRSRDSLALAAESETRRRDRELEPNAAQRDHGDPRARRTCVWQRTWAVKSGARETIREYSTRFEHAESRRNASTGSEHPRHGKARDVIDNARFAYPTPRPRPFACPWRCRRVVTVPAAGRFADTRRSIVAASGSQDDEETTNADRAKRWRFSAQNLIS